MLHLIATHHGYGRPHFPTDKAFDPKASEDDTAEIAAEVPRRFARLQRKYGRWGLAYLESKGVKRVAQAENSANTHLNSPNLAFFSARFFLVEVSLNSEQTC